MADVTVIEALSLLTKVSADTSSLIKKLSTRIDSIESNTGKKVKEKLVKKADPVIVTDFGKAAEKDLAKIGNNAEKERQNTEKEKNKNNNLLKLLGLAGAAALALKFLFDGEGFVGLTQGFQRVYKRVETFAKSAKGLIDDIGKRLGTFADDIGARVGTIVDDVMAKTNTWAAKAKDGIKNAMDDIGRRLSTFGDDIARGVTKVINGASNMAGRVTTAMSNTPSTFGDYMSSRSNTRGLSTPSRVPTPKPSLLSRAGSFLSSTADTAVGGLKAAGGAVLDTGKAGLNVLGDAGRVVGGTIMDGGRALGDFTKKQILDRISAAFKIIKPLKLLKGIAKSPLLAPALESFFAAKDINNNIDKYSTGEIDKKELDFLVGERLIKAITGVIGGAGGAILGGMLGAVGGPLSFVTMLAGGVLGDIGGRFIGGLISQALGPKTGSVGDYALSSPLFTIPPGSGASQFDKIPEEIEDGIITVDGKVIKPDSQDTIYAMKDGGPLGDALSYMPDMLGKLINIEKDREAINNTPKLLSTLIDIEADNLNETKKQNLILKGILEKTGIVTLPSNNQTNNSKNFEQTGDTFRMLQTNY